MKERFTSIRHPVSVDAGLGRLQVEESYAAHVEQLIKQVLLTNPGERINRPDFGCGIRRMIFGPASDATANLVQVSVFQALSRWLEPVIEVDEVKVTAVEETLTVGVRYLLKARQEKRYLNVEVAL